MIQCAASKLIIIQLEFTSTWSEILGNIKKTNLLTVTVCKSLLLLHLLNTGRSCIAECWKQPQPPSLARCNLKVNDIQRMEELVALDKETRVKFWNCWLHRLEFQSSRDYTANLADTLTGPWVCKGWRAPSRVAPKYIHSIKVYWLRPWF